MLTASGNWFALKTEMKIDSCGSYLPVWWYHRCCSKSYLHSRFAFNEHQAVPLTSSHSYGLLMTEEWETNLNDSVETTLCLLCSSPWWCLIWANPSQHLCCLSPRLSLLLPHVLQRVQHGWGLVWWVLVWEWFALGGAQLLLELGKVLQAVGCSDQKG